MLIQHNPNEGLKRGISQHCPERTPVLIQHNPNEGLKRRSPAPDGAGRQVLIQHNPNEGLKRRLRQSTPSMLVGAHSAQPERGIETQKLFSKGGLWGI